ncbi:T9SS type A sorting domain-containing protein [candidate division TA06 bacterium]|uniref:T9SS type A sorting domain-containing protein n=1 Tax=candidate division TA06 bacterium TaxID=2250710 RepID=A0A933IDC3_UNCT6|nr:T9SS type A sorting domain-containing protein [candidate division TA06 bacterium]
MNRIDLFLSLDGGINYTDTIRLWAPVYTPYVWKVPNKSSKTCKIKVIAYDSGYNPISDESDVSFGVTMTGVAGDPGNREQIFVFRLWQNAPNPFKQLTTINYQLPQAGQVSLKIYNINGQLVRTLFKGNKESGQYSVIWNGTDNKNRKISNGIYIVKLKANQQTITNRIILIK